MVEASVIIPASVRGRYVWMCGGLLLVTLAAGLWFSPSAAGQEATGGIRGRVTDKEFEVSLSSAQVIVQELQKVSETDDTGHFAFHGVAPGTYTLVVRKEGFQRAVRNRVVVTSGSMTTVDIALAGVFVDMQEVVVRPLKLEAPVEVLPEMPTDFASELGLLQLKADSIGILDAVGVELMSKTGAGSAAEAMRLVSGATIKGGKYAIIRGLSDRYLNTRLNGVAVPTADPDVRAVQLDLFPSALLESVQVHKTFTPDLPGNTSGGSVNITTKAMPEERFFEFSAGTSFHSEATGNEDFLTSHEGMDYWGLDKGVRKQTLQNGRVPQVITGPRGGDSPWINNPTWTDAEREDAALLDRQTRGLSPYMGTTREKPPPNHSWGMSYGDRIQLSGDTAVGWLGAVTYSEGYTYYRDGVDRFLVGKRDLTGFEVPVESGETDENPDPDQWKVEKGSHTIDWGVGGTIGFESGDHTIALSYMRTQATEDEAAILYDDETSEKVYWHNQSVIYTARSLDSLQLRGTTPLTPGIENERLGIGIGSPTLDWSIATNSATQDQPDRRFFLASYNPNTGVWGPPRKPKNFAERSWREILEENDYYELKLTLPYSLGEDMDGELKAGISLNDTDRSYTQDSFYYTLPNVGGSLPSYLPGVEGSANSPAETYATDTFGDLWTDVFLRPENLGYPPPIGQGAEFGQSYFGDDVLENEVNWVIQQFSDDVDYTGVLRVKSWFGMADVPLTPWLHVVGGVRYEETNMATDVNAADGNDGEARVLNVRIDPETPDFVSANSINASDPTLDMTLDKLANASISQIDVLPSIGIIVDLFRDVKLRATWSRTIARPTFKEITPVSQQDHLNGAQFAGNPDLQISQLTNYDVRLEWMPGDGRLISTSVFYKDIQDPIDYAQRPAAGSTPYIIPFNFEHGEVLGAELEIRQDLGRYVKFLKGFTIGANATLLDASVAVPERDQRKLGEMLTLQGRDPRNFDLDERRMKDQPEYLFNLFLLYECENLGTSAALYLNHTGETLIAGEDANGADYIGNRVAKPYTTLNVTFSQKLTDTVKLSVKAENVLDPDIDQVWQSDFIPEEAIAESYRKGVTFSLSLSATF